MQLRVDVTTVTNRSKSRPRVVRSCGATSRLLDCKIIYDFESFKVDRIETSFNNTFIIGNYYYTSVWLKVEYKVLIFSKGVWIFLMILKKKSSL